MPGIIIQSNNFNGKSVQITFSPFSGGSINLGTQTIPYTYTTTNYEGNYSIYIPDKDDTCFLQVGVEPSLTPTPTITPTPTPTSSLSDAQLFINDVINAGGTLDPIQEASIYVLFNDLETNNFYDRMIAFYPFVGGVGASHALNGKRSASQYDITWNGGVSHDVSGTTTNGTNGYGNTNFTYSAFTNPVQSTFGMYLITTGSTLDTSDSSGNQGTPTEAAGLIFGNIGSGKYRHGNSDGNPLLWSNYSTPNNQLGMFISVRENSSSSRVFQNAVGIRNHSSAYTPTQNVPFSIGAITNTTTQSNFTDSKINFLFFANNILQSEVSSLTTIINTFQTNLGRNTY